MKLDYKTKVIIAEVREELYKEDGTNLSQEEISSVFFSQFKGCELAMSKGFDFKIYKFGRFKRNLNTYRNQTIGQLRQLKNLIDKDVYVSILNRYKEQYKDWANNIERNKRSASVDDVLESPCIVGLNRSFSKTKRTLEEQEAKQDNYEYL